MNKQFNIADDTITTQITVTNGFFDGGVGTLAGSNLSTSSLSATQKSYYYNLQYNSKDHFSLTYGHILGSGSAVEDTTTEGTTQAIYKQFFNFTEPSAENLRDGSGWSMIDGTNGANAVTQEGVYILAAERLQMKDRLNPGTWTLNLSGSNSAGAAASLSLTDDSKTVEAESAPFGNRYHIVEGSAGAVTTAYTTKTYGFFYPDMGILILNGPVIASPFSASLSASVASNAEGGNVGKFYEKIEGGNYFQARREEVISSQHYFCRVPNKEFNFSSNPTFTSGSQGNFTVPTFYRNPKSFITQVGLYNDNNELLAIAKLSKPLLKSYSREAIIKVKLDF